MAAGSRSAGEGWLTAAGTLGVAPVCRRPVCTPDRLLRERRYHPATPINFEPPRVRASDNKLLAAQEKLVDGKNADAIAKLVDFRTKIEQLSAGKLGAADASELIAGANGAIACIDSISATA
jgi:hypothetical protein